MVAPRKASSETTRSVNGLLDGAAAVETPLDVAVVEGRGTVLTMIRLRERNICDYPFDTGGVLGTQYVVAGL
jgi:hypothetical protein